MAKLSFVLWGRRDDTPLMAECKRKFRAGGKDAVLEWLSTLSIEQRRKLVEDAAEAAENETWAALFLASMPEHFSGN